MTIGSNDVLTGTLDTLKVIPEAYEDLAQPAVKETGKLIGMIPRAINAAFSGIHIWILKKEYLVDETKVLLSEKLKNVAPEKIIPPLPYVAVPAIQALSYSMDSERLRDLYVNLLAKSMHIDETQNVHPCFVEIIKQMSPLDAQVMRCIAEENRYPIIYLSQRNCEDHSRVSIDKKMITWMTCSDHSLIEISISNLCRNGIISTNIDSHYEDETIYDKILESENFKMLLHRFEKTLSKDFESYIEKRFLDITELGKLFISVCVKAIPIRIFAPPFMPD